MPTGWTEIIVAIIALFGTLGGSYFGVMKSTSLVTYRLEQLEKKVDKHNNFAENIPLLTDRIKRLEEKADVQNKQVEQIPVVVEQIKVINHRIEDLEGKK